jgi:hypothetical protein
MLRRIAVTLTALFIAGWPIEAVHACTELPDYWTVRVTSITPQQAELPIGITIAATSSELILDNQTNQDAFLLLVPSGGRDTSFLAPAHNTLPIPIEETHLLFAADISPGTELFEEPSLPSSASLVLLHDDLRYVIPVTLAYDVQYFPQAGGCAAFWRRQYITSLLMTIVPVLIIAVGIAFVVLSFFARKSSP